MIPFNKPFLVGNELQYIEQAVQSGKISGNGDFTKKCQTFFEEKYMFQKALLTHSCTDALEMAAILIDAKIGDEIIMPSYTFVSTANAFVLRGAKIVFVDSQDEHPNMAVKNLESLITTKTKAMVVVHYAGMACPMEEVLELAEKHNLWVIEDAAQGLDAFYKNRPLGSIGHLSAFSFHETKNVIAGEGGLLAINDKRLIERAEIVWEKGTNRSAFFRGEVDKYSWVDVGSSFLPSEITAAFLYAQLENLDKIQSKRKKIWQMYYDKLLPLAQKGLIELPNVPTYTTHNAHLFYLVCQSLEERDALIAFLRENGIYAVFHYLSLHQSPFYASKHDGRKLINCERYANCLLRLPLFYELTDEEQAKIINTIYNFYE